MKNIVTVTIPETLDGEHITWTAQVCETGHVTLFRDDTLAGVGRWNGRAIEDCPVDAPDHVFTRLDAAIAAVTLA